MFVFGILSFLTAILMSFMGFFSLFGFFIVISMICIFVPLYWFKGRGSLFKGFVADVREWQEDERIRSIERERLRKIRREEYERERGRQEARERYG